MCGTLLRIAQTQIFMDKYTTYKTKDFITDEDFLDWVYNPNKDNSQKWQQWLSNHPQKQKTIEEARQILASIQHKERFSDKNPERVFQAIQNNIHQLSTSPDKRKSLFSPRRLSLVAVFALIALSTTYLIYTTYFNNTSTQVYATTYGEVQKVILPDGSKVWLNGNSKLTILEEFLSKQRAVIVEGEAYFSIQKKRGNNPYSKEFIVQTQNIDIEVLGTEFNVNAHRDITKVVLNEGKVKIREQAAAGKQELILLPGEMSEYDPEDGALHKKEVSVPEYISWKNNQLVFDRTPLLRIAEILEDTYGFEVAIKNKVLEEREFVGSYPADDIEVLLITIGTVIDVQKEGKKLVFQNK